MHRVFRYNGKTIEALGNLRGGHASFAKGKDGRPYLVWGIWDTLVFPELIRI